MIEVEGRYGVIATNISRDMYLENYAERFCEWEDGIVTKQPSISVQHNDLSIFMMGFFGMYFALKPVGRLVIAPFVLCLDHVASIREPDLQIILNEHIDRLKPTYVDGAADICIEIVSPGSVEIDYVKKFKEYEQAGVGEYWILDPMRQDALFYRRNTEGVFQRHNEGTDGNYSTPLLPQFALHVPKLWRNPLPNAVEVTDMVKKMVEG